MMFSWPQHFRRFLTLTLILGTGAVASAQTLVYENFASTVGLQVNGDAAVVTTADGKVMRLVPAESTQAGTFFTEQKYNVTGFSTVFEFRMTNRGGISNDGSGRIGADGLAFVIQNEGKYEVGEDGGGLGYEGISPSVAVEFDTYFNDGKDPSLAHGGSNHVGINLGGSANSVKTGPVGTNMDDGARWTVWVDYDGTTLEVRMSTNGLRPTDAILTKNLDIAAQVNGDSAYLGFTAGTGGAYSNHDLLGWAYSDTYIPGGLASVPEPGTYALLGLGGMLLLGARRFKRGR